MHECLILLNTFSYILILKELIVKSILFLHRMQDYPVSLENITIKQIKLDFNKDLIVYNFQNKIMKKNILDLD